jgi:hypothetical protein
MLRLKLTLAALTAVALTLAPAVDALASVARSSLELND